MIKSTKNALEEFEKQLKKFENLEHRLEERRRIK